MQPEPIHFHRPPRRIRIADQPPVPTFTEDDMDNARTESYKRGYEEASQLLRRQMMDQRAEMGQLQGETFKALEQQHHTLLAQFRQLLPGLALDIARRVLGGVEIDRDAVVRLVDDILAAVPAGREGLEVALSAHDLALIEGNDAQFREKHPEIRFRADASLKSGDCVVRSRFGEIDGRLDTKLRSVERLLQ